MKALVFERSAPKYAAAAVAGRLAPGAGARVGPLALKTVDPPDLPGPGWVRVRPRLAGICGSDLATVDGHSSRYFEPFVSFPFVPGHEVVGETEDGRRVVLMATLRCAARGFEEPCPACRYEPQLCERTTLGHLPPGLQTGYCEGTGGGWSTGLVAHESQLFAVPDDFTDEAAVLIEPVACAVHAARWEDRNDQAVIGAGMLGLATAAATTFINKPRRLLAAAKHPAQKAWAKEFGAHTVVDPADLDRAARRLFGSAMEGGYLAVWDGIEVVYDCVGSEASLAQALRIVERGGKIRLIGMPGKVSIDLAPLWHREVELSGSYAYSQSDFETAVKVIRQFDMGRLVSALYPLDRYREAIDHAANAGRRGAVKIAFDLRAERRS